MLTCVPPPSLVINQRIPISVQVRPLRTTVSVTNGVGVHPRGAAPDSLGLRFENALDLDEVNCDCNVDRKEVCRAMAPSNLKGPEGFILGPWRSCIDKVGPCKLHESSNSTSRDVSICRIDRLN